MPSSWPSFAFAEESDWGRCYTAFLRQVYEHSGAESTRTHYRSDLAAFFTTPPARLPDAYTRADVEAFIHSPCRARGRTGPPGPGTMNNRLSCLTSFYAYAATYTITGADGQPVPLLTRMAPTVGFKHVQRAKSYRTLSLADFEQFFAAIPIDTERGLRDRALFLMYFWTARRRIEIVSLRWRDIEATTLIDDNAARRPGWLYHFRGKGHGRQDDVAELPQPAKDVLDLYLTASGRLDSMQPDSPLFTTEASYHGQGGHDPMRPLHPTTAWNAIKRYARAAGIDPKRITTHSFRHMAAQERYKAGEDIRSLQQLLRHTSLATTDAYLRGLIATADNGAKLLEEKFGRFGKVTQSSPPETEREKKASGGDADKGKQ